MWVIRMSQVNATGLFALGDFLAQRDNEESWFKISLSKLIVEHQTLFPSNSKQFQILTYITSGQFQYIGMCFFGWIHKWMQLLIFIFENVYNIVQIFRNIIHTSSSFHKNKDTIYMLTLPFHCVLNQPTNVTMVSVLRCG